MNLPKAIKQRLTQEYRFAADKMAVESDIPKKLFFLSAFFGEAGRSLNWGWDRDLVLIHSVLQHTHQQLNARLQGGSRSMVQLDAVLESLTKAADELATYMETDGRAPNLQDILGHFAELAFASTGNGSYLLERGVLKL